MAYKRKTNKLKLFCALIQIEQPEEELEEGTSCKGKLMTMCAVMINDARRTIYCRDAVSLQTYAICRGSRGSKGRERRSGEGRQANKKMNNTCQVALLLCNNAIKWAWPIVSPAYCQIKL